MICNLLFWPFYKYSIRFWDIVEVDFRECRRSVELSQFFKRLVLLRLCIIFTFSLLVVIECVVRIRIKSACCMAEISISQSICFVRGEESKDRSPLPPQGQPCRDWSYYISCFTIKGMMTSEENNLAKTGFYKLQHLKVIIQLDFLVIDRIFVWVFLPQLPDTVNSHYAELACSCFLIRVPAFVWSSLVLKYMFGSQTICCQMEPYCHSQVYRLSERDLSTFTLMAVLP